MPLSLRIENVDQLPDGGPVTYTVDKRGLDIGRDAFMDWTLPDTQRFISGTHCQVRYEKNGYWIHDVSTNGTMINSPERRITEPYELKSGDRLFIGGYIVVVEVTGEEPAGGAAADGAGAGSGNPGDLWGVDGAAAPIDRQSFQREAAHPGHAPQPIGGDLADENIGWGMSVGGPAATDPGELDWGVSTGGAGGGSADLGAVDWGVPDGAPKAAPAPAPEPAATPPAPDAGGAASWAPPTPDAPPAAAPPAAAPPDADAPAADWRAAPPDPIAAPASAPPVGAFEVAEPTPPPAVAFDAAPPPSAPASDAFAPPPPPETSAAAASAGAFDAMPEPAAITPPPVADPEPEDEPLQLVNPVAVPQPAAREPAAPPPPHPAASSGGGSVIAAFERGAGLQPGAVAAASEEQFAEEMGQLFRATAENLQAMLMARQETKSAIRSSEVTQIGALENNPLKFSPSIEDAMKVMLGEKTRSYLDAQKTVEQSFADLQKHQLYTFNAMQQALSALIEDLDPENIAGATSKDGGLASIVSSRRAKLWDIYVERFRSKSGAQQRGMVGAFMLLFADMYDRQG